MRLRVAAALTTALVLGTAVGAAQAAPDDTVTAKDVERAFHEVEVVNEQVNQLTVDIDATREEIADLTEEVAEQRAGYERQREALGAAIVQQQLDSPLGPTVNLFGSEDPEEFLDGLGAVQALNSTRTEKLEAFAATSARLESRQDQLEDREKSLAADRKKIRAKRDEVRRGYEAAKAELERLTAAQQAKLNASTTTLDFDVDAEGRAKKAIEFAQAQLGEPYVYGGTGPNGWDCSGLVMKSFAAAGVSLPRVVGPQYAASRKIPLSALRPGDIVFYGDMSHDGIYLGNGRVLHAPRPGKSVEVTSMSGFTKAGRVV